MKVLIGGIEAFAEAALAQPEDDRLSHGWDVDAQVVGELDFDIDGYL